MRGSADPDVRTELGTETAETSARPRREQRAARSARQCAGAESEAKRGASSSSFDGPRHHTTKVAVLGSEEILRAYSSTSGGSYVLVLSTYHSQKPMNIPMDLRTLAK